MNTPQATNPLNDCNDCQTLLEKENVNLPTCPHRTILGSLVRHTTKDRVGIVRWSNYRSVELLSPVPANPKRVEAIMGLYQEVEVIVPLATVIEESTPRRSSLVRPLVPGGLYFHDALCRQLVHLLRDGATSTEGLIKSLPGEDALAALLVGDLQNRKRGLERAALAVESLRALANAETDSTRPKLPLKVASLDGAQHEALIADVFAEER